MTATKVAKAFVEAVNSKQLDRLTELMTADHVFIDSDGSEYSGREEIRRGWEDYFSMVPDYEIKVKDAFSNENTVVLLGAAERTFGQNGRLEAQNHLAVPAAWRVVVDGAQVAVWQLYVNPEPMQEILRRIDPTE